MEIKITDNNFETEVKACSLPVLVIFTQTGAARVK